MIINRHTPNPLVKLEKSVRAALLQEHFFTPEQTFKILNNTISNIVKQHHKDALFEQPGFLFGLAKKTPLKEKAFLSELKSDDDVRKLINGDTAYNAARRALRPYDIFQTPFGHFKIDINNYSGNESKVQSCLQALCFTQTVNNVMQSLVDNATISESRLRNLFNVHLSMKLLAADTNSGIYNDDKADKHQIFSDKIKSAVVDKLDSAINAEKNLEKTLEK